MSRQSIKEDIRDNLLPDQFAEFISPELERTAIDLVIDGSFNLQDDNADDIPFNDSDFASTNIGDAVREVKDGFSFGFGNLAVSTSGRVITVSGGVPNSRLAIRSHTRFKSGNYSGWSATLNPYVISVSGIEIGQVDYTDTQNPVAVFVHNGVSHNRNPQSYLDPYYLHGIFGDHQSAEVVGGLGDMFLLSNPIETHVTLDANGSFSFSDTALFSPSLRSGDEFFIEYKIDIVGIEYRNTGFPDRKITSDWVEPLGQTGNN